MLSGWTIHPAHVEQKDEHILKRDKRIQGNEGFTGINEDLT